MTDEHALARAVPAWAAEACGWGAALLLSLVAVAHLDATDRSWMLYYDPETVLPALVRGSAVAGQPQDWALSAVLFIPEMALYLGLAALGLGVKGTFALNAAVNFLLLYGALRLVSGAVRPGRPHGRRIAGALVAFGAVIGLSLLEDTSGWDTFEVASLLATATFYSTTVLAVTATTGLVARAIAARSGQGSGATPGPKRGRWLAAALFAVSAVATLTNPLYLAWEAAPLVVVFAMLGWRRVVAWVLLARVAAVLGAGAVVGLAGRIPFAALITKDGPAYAKPGQALGTAIYYAEKLADRASTLPGALSLTFAVALVVGCVLVFRRSLARRDAATALVAGVGWVAPLGVLVGAVALGIVGTRYVQPLFFAPVCLLVLAPDLAAPGALARRLPARGLRVLLAGWAAACLAASAILTASLGSSAGRIDADVRCVDAWVSASHRTGAGRYWTIRGPKAYLAEPNQLVQVDDAFNAYPWLTDRDDYRNVPAVSFVLSDDRYPAPPLPSAARGLPHETVACGRYTITDFGQDVLAIGPAHANATP
ncbi:hypothetical protein SPF06_01855 [Sinomonas sp. JGH33]|uniref:Glycosyltransferase RgtA/B/C/D-like domain-containing protein n=1 Tax=Sinomonas terricola TaxID=3110330 RepID=A0ABU5T1C0_9MICC|nr:hypothetical protein [Sinomonas sp. JGH33]MEA5453457.1 hypothetical protein [Sinomonas sp. JGH33]